MVPIASIVLPTCEWTGSCESLYEQVREGDELLVVTDSPTDPAASVAAERDAAELVVAGEPVGCSGKSNAVAAGLERASQDVILLTDDDVPRGPGWIEGLEDGVEEHGAVSGAPLFVHTGGTGRVLGWMHEPAQALGVVLLTFSNGVWGGATGFHRRHVDDWDAMVADLRRTVTDDLVIGEHLTVDRAADVDYAVPVPVEASLGEFLDRMVRFTLTFRYSEATSLGFLFLLGGLQLLALLLAPLTATLVTLLAGVGVYAVFGVARWTVLFAPISLVANAFLAAYGATRTEFGWGGRRYRWTGKFSVEVLGPE